MSQREYTPEELEYLITCPKEIVNPPKQTMTLTNGHYRNSMDLCSVDGKHKFHVYMRKNEKFQENFSIGLEYCPNDGTPNITLLRCNGPHGEHINDWKIDEHFFGYHIHIATAENINSGLRPEKNAVLTNSYATFEDALSYFLNRCNIIGAEKYFVKYNQITLFPD